MRRTMRGAPEPADPMSHRHAPLDPSALSVLPGAAC